MQQIHSLCPICNKDQYQQTISNLNNFDTTSSNNLTTIELLLNPIIYTYRAQLIDDQQAFIFNHEIIANIQYQYYYVEQNLTLPMHIDLLYGFDFFIQGCYLLYEGQDESANQHFKLFDKINQLTRPVFKRNLPEFTKFTNHYFNDVCDEYFHILKQFCSEHDNQTEEMIFQYVTKQFRYFLQLLEDLQFFINEFSSNSPQFNLEKKEKLHQCQISLALTLQDYSEQALFTKVYLRFLQTQNYTDSIGGILFKDFERSQTLWNIYFVKLTGDQRLSHIHSLIYYLDKLITKMDFSLEDPNSSKSNVNFQRSVLIQNNDTLYITNIIKLGKALKKQQEYWLALVVFSFYRKLSKIEKLAKHFNFVSYLPLVYCEIAKISLYLGQFNGAYKLYQEASEKVAYLKKMDLEVKCSIRQSQDGMLLKIQTKILLLSLFLQKRDEATKRASEILTMPQVNYNLSAFATYCNKYLTESKVFNSTVKLRRCDQFLAHLQSLMSSSLPSMQVPKGDLLKLANIIELKDQDIPKCILKQETKFLLKCNLIFETLQFYFILVSNSKPETFSSKHYFEQLEMLELFLQQIDCSVYPQLSKILEQFHFQQYHYENLLLCHFHQYISMYHQSQQYLKIFDKMFIPQNKKLKEGDTFIRIREKYWSEIFFHHQEFSRALKSLEACRDINQQYQIGIIQLQCGQFQEGLRQLKQVAQSDHFYDVCYYHLMDYLNRSRGDMQKFPIKQFYNNLDELFSRVNIDFLASQYLFSARSRSRSIFLESRSNIVFDSSFDASYMQRSSSIFNQEISSSLTDFINQISDRTLIALINLVMTEASKLSDFTIHDLRARYPKQKGLQNGVTRYENDQEVIVIKQKSLINNDISRFSQKLKEILVEIQCQLLVNKLQHPGCAQLLHLQYTLLISNKFEVNFYLVYPYYEQLELMDKPKLQSLIESVKFLNENQIYHRDLKPENIRQKDNIPVLIDFDCAYYWEQTLKEWMGGNGLTTKYYPNEDVQQDKVDIYSIGIIAKELVADCPDNFYNLATQPYKERCSLQTLLKLLN